MKNLEPAYTVFVNSCDGFEDCWFPFFELLRVQWPSLRAPILLVTEQKTYEFPGLDIRSAQVQPNRAEPRLTWSECVLRALDQVDTDLVLYFQEDYFLEGPVLEETLNRLADKMLEDPTIQCLGLTHFGSMGPFNPTDDPEIVEVDVNARYRVTCQVSLWRKSALISYLRPDENAWMFEIFGTQRSRRRGERFLAVNPKLFSPPQETPIVPYELTGIIKGKWKDTMPTLFSKYNIPMDFTIRGFYREKPFLLRKLETASKLFREPIRAINGLRGI